MCVVLSSPHTFPGRDLSRQESLADDEERARRSNTQRSQSGGVLSLFLTHSPSLPPSLSSLHCSPSLTCSLSPLTLPHMLRLLLLCLLFRSPFGVAFLPSSLCFVSEPTITVSFCSEISSISFVVVVESIDQYHHHCLHSARMSSAAETVPNYLMIANLPNEMQRKYVKRGMCWHLYCFRLRF